MPIGKFRNPSMGNRYLFARRYADCILLNTQGLLVLCSLQNLPISRVPNKFQEAPSTEKKTYKKKLSEMILEKKSFRGGSSESWEWRDEERGHLIRNKITIFWWLADIEKRTRISSFFLGCLFKLSSSSPRIVSVINLLLLFVVTSYSIISFIDHTYAPSPTGAPPQCKSDKSIAS